MGSSSSSMKIFNSIYEIKKELGRRGFGKVNQVLNKSNKKYYAMKEIPLNKESEEKIQ